MHTGRVTVGHPIDVASGVVYATHPDVSLPGRVPLSWERRYSSDLLQTAPGPLGPGWTAGYFSRLIRQPGEYRFHTPEGGLFVFNDPEGIVEREGVLRDLGTFQELARRNNHYVITRWDVDSGDIERFLFDAGKVGEVLPLRAIEDHTGQGVDLVYGKADRLVGLQQRLEKRAIVLDYTPVDRLGEVSLRLAGDQKQLLMRYEYDLAGRLIAAYDALGQADRYEYDKDSRLVREISKDGGVFSFSYDDKGRCIRTAGLNRFDEKRFRYIDNANWTEVTDSTGAVMRYQWLPSRQVCTEVDPLGGITRTDYDDLGRISVRTSPNGGTVRYEYDQFGNRAKLINPLGEAFTWVYSAEHLPLTLTAPDGRVWKREYDASNRVVGTEDPLGAKWSIVYDGRGNLIQMTEPGGATLRQKFSDRGELLEASDWLGHVKRYRFDEFGRVVERTSPMGDAVGLNYDAVGNLVAAVLPDGARVTWAYDAGGNVIRRTAAGNTWTYRYGPCRRLIEAKDPLGSVLGYDWSTEPRRLEKITNAKGEEYRFGYDEAGRVVREVGFDGRVLGFERDAAGGCVGYVNGLGEKVGYELDPMGRIVAVALPDGSQNTFAFDCLGNLIKATSPDYAVTFTRDEAGNVVAESQDEHRIETRYDRSGFQVGSSSSLGLDVNYRIDANGRLAGMVAGGRHQFEWQRNPRGDETSCTLPGQFRLEHDYDRLGQLIAQRLLPPSAAGGRSALLQREYRYEGATALASMKDGKGGVRYAYDAAERLIQAVWEDGLREDFSYDAANNITRMSGPAGVEELVYGPGGRLLRQGSTEYTYDAQGRLINKVEKGSGGESRVWRYTWNALDQMRKVQTPEGAVWEYFYDALGRRIRKKGPETEVRFVWDRDRILHEVQGDSAASTWLFGPTGLRPIALLQGSDCYPVITDHLGTPRELIDRTGKVVWRASFTSWGEPRSPSEGKIDCPLRFPGQWFDAETGLHYNRFRYYDPHSARYICADPSRLWGGYNLYAYTRNPVNWIDPFGLNQGGKQQGCGGDDPHEEDRKKIPDDTLIVRGGVVNEEQIRNGSGVSVDASGKVSGVSVNTGTTVAAATAPIPATGYQGIPNGQVGVTTAGEIRAAGGRVRPDPTTRNPGHAEVSGLPPDKLAGTFEQQQNPNARKRK